MWLVKGDFIVRILCVSRRYSIMEKFMLGLYLGAVIKCKVFLLKGVGIVGIRKVLWNIWRENIMLGEYVCQKEGKDMSISTL